MRLIKCDKCNFHLFRKGVDDKWRLSTQIVIVDKDSPLRVVCRKCGHEQDFPAKFSFFPFLPIEPESESSKTPKLVISRKSRKVVDVKGGTG